jgi:pyruvate-formate lyase-activating enzyme
MNINSNLKYIKSEKFKQLSEKRVNQVLDKLRILGNLGNKSNYQYTQKDVDKIFKAIEKALKESKNKFRSSNKRDNYEFKW